MRQTFLRKNLLLILFGISVFGFLAGQVFAGDLTVAVSATPDFGVGQLPHVDLTAQVSGTATGNITYKFDCTSDGVWDLITPATSQVAYTAVDLCHYTSPGNYTATVRAERDIYAAQSTLAIIVDPYPKPTVDLKVNNSDGPVTINYNTAATLTWTSTNATACTASVDWSGAKATQNTTGESTGNLTSPKTYTIICSGPGGNSDPDSVIVYIKPTVDIKANNSDGPITIDYNTAATLTWTSTNATACTASVDWSGAKATQNTTGESTGNLTSAKTYTIVCSGLGGNSNPDSVTVNVNPQKTLYVAFEPYPNAGAAPLNGVDFRITVTGTASGLITYRIDCTGNGNWMGSWEHEAPNQSANPYFANDICDGSYPTAGTYAPKFQVVRDGLTINGNSTIIATSGNSNPTLFVNLSSQPSSGSAPLNTVLTATVTGTATGSVSFTFNCGNGGASQTVTPSGTTANYNCSYASASVYTARVSATRGGLTSQGNTIIIVP